MRAAAFFALIFISFVSGFLIFINDASSERLKIVENEKLEGQFVNYIASVNAFYLNGPPDDGDFTSRLNVPEWLGEYEEITFRVSDGVGYLYTPSESGLFGQLLEMTENSAHIGISYSDGIKTVIAIYTRPEFIPPGCIVYMRWP